MNKILAKKTPSEDFQGWPQRYLTVGDLKTLLEKHNDDIDDASKILILEDDGTAYGPNNGYCTDIEIGSDDDENKEIRLWF